MQLHSKVSWLQLPGMCNVILVSAQRAKDTSGRTDLHVLPHL